MHVKAGKWELRATHQQEGVQRTSDVKTLCIEEAGMTPQAFINDPSCTVSDATSDERSMSWTVVCENRGGRMSGDAQFTSAGTTVDGVMTMRIEVAGGQGELRRIWKGRWLGACD
jgi:hypothetical protein